MNDNTPVIEINLKSIEVRIESASNELERRKEVRLDARRELEDELINLSDGKYKTITEDINDQQAEKTRLKKLYIKSNRSIAARNEAAKDAHKEVEKQKRLLSELLAEYYATHNRSLEVELQGGRKLIIVNQMKLF